MANWIYDIVFFLSYVSIVEPFAENNDNFLLILLWHLSYEFAGQTEKSTLVSIKNVRLVFYRWQIGGMNENVWHRSPWPLDFRSLFKMTWLFTSDRRIYSGIRKIRVPLFRYYDNAFDVDLCRLPRDRSRWFANLSTQRQNGGLFFEFWKLSVICAFVLCCTRW